MTNRKHTSFTLIEMLAGAAVFSILILLLFSILSMSTKLWLTQSSTEEGFREARAALNTMSRDLSAAITTPNNQWYYGITNGSSSTIPAQLAFLTTLPDAAQPTGVDKGDICAVGYSLEYTTNDASATEVNMSLYRYVAFSDWTYNNVVNTNNPSAESVSAIFSSVDNVNVTKSLIARNVSQFAFTGYTNDAAGNLIAEQNPILPETIDISLTALNERVAKLLTSEAMWENSSNTLLLQNESTFNLRVRTVPQ